MKKGTTGFLMTTSVITLSLHALEARAATIPHSHLTWATSSDPEGTLPLGERRSNPAAAYGKFDVKPLLQTIAQQEARVFSLRTAPDKGAYGTTYFYDNPSDFNDDRKIIPNPDKNLPDLYIRELTWIPFWHIESSTIKLINAAVVDLNGNITRVPEYEVGVAFNNAALEPRNKNHPMVVQNRSKNLYQYLGFETVTAFKFPPEVLEADAVKILDSTDQANRNAEGQIINTSLPFTPSLAYKDSRDGFDLDAIGVQTTPAENCDTTIDFAVVARNKNVCSGQPIPFHLRGEFDSNYSVLIKKGDFEARAQFYFTGDSCLYQGNYYLNGINGGPGTYTFTVKKRNGDDFTFTADLTCE
jgi:hypothetical protein